VNEIKYFDKTKNKIFTRHQYQKMSNLILIFASLIYFQINYLILNLIDDTVFKPYMDEIFHVPQAQEYCSGNYNEVNREYFIFNFVFIK